MKYTKAILKKFGFTERRKGGEEWHGSSYGMLLLDVELEVHGSGSGGRDAELDGGALANTNDRGTRDI